MKVVREVKSCPFCGGKAIIEKGLHTESYLKVFHRKGCFLNQGSFVHIMDLQWARKWCKRAI